MRRTKRQKRREHTRSDYVHANPFWQRKRYIKIERAT
jgi:hypothetical protein